MFIFNLTYIKPLSVVDQSLTDHIQFLDSYYEKGAFLCSGRKVPRTGGIIICDCDSMEEAEEIISEDPFYTQDIAQYEMIAFVPSKVSDALEQVFSGTILENC